jgi:hypothetical protein
MIVVVPFCRKDIEAARRLLEWIAELDGCHKNHPCALIGAKPLTDEEIAPVIAAAKSAFSSVTMIRQRTENESGWPRACNAMFRCALEYTPTQRLPWLWLEPDATPLRPGWLNKLEVEYAKSKKPFMGAFYPLPVGHLNGVAIYPANPVRYNSRLLSPGAEPFDCVFPNLTLRYSHISPSFHHEWSPEGHEIDSKPRSFGSPLDLAILKPDALIYHRCKDGSLIQRLRERQSQAVRSTTKKGSSVCVVCLGRFGDIMGALPIAQRVARDTGLPCHFMVAREFASILDGVSYVVPAVFEGQYSEMGRAVALAKEQFKRVIVAQVFSTDAAAPDGDVAHNRLAWRVAGFEQHFQDLPLVFDVRNHVEERRLISIKRDARPVLLLSLTTGLSGPFKDGKEVQARIVSKFPQFQIIDLAKVRGRRIFDLLGLLEIGSGLISNDTSIHHLATAVPSLPCAVFLPDNRYYAAEPRCRLDVELRYGTWREYIHLLDDWLLKLAATSPIIHVWDAREKIDDRVKRGQATWPAMWQAFGWTPAPFKPPYPRDSRSIGDPRGVPFLRDILKHALEQTKDPNAIIVFTNDDLIMLPGLHEDLLASLSQAPCVASSRRDIAAFSQVRPQGPTKHHVHVGRDLFGFRAWWLKNHMPEIPDLIVGTNDWDNVMVNMMRQHCGCLVEGQWSNAMACAITACEMASPNLLHEDHLSYADKFKLGVHNKWNHCKMVEWALAKCPTIAFPWAQASVIKLRAGEFTFKPVIL